MTDKNPFHKTINKLLNSLLFRKYYFCRHEVNLIFFYRYRPVPEYYRPVCTKQ